MFALGTLLLGLALTPNSNPSIKIKALYFGTNPKQIGIKDRHGEIAPHSIYAHSFTPYFAVHCPENKLTLYRIQPHSSESAQWLPWVSATVPSSGENFLAIISETPSPKLYLLSDSHYPQEGGIFHIFNLSSASVAIDFPGQKKVLTRGQSIQFRPQVKNATYGQGRFSMVGEIDAETRQNGVRWLQMEDIRSFWFILPPSFDGPSFVLKNIEDRILVP